MNKKIVAWTAAAAMSAAMLTGCGGSTASTSTTASTPAAGSTSAANAAAFPTQDMNGIVQWGEGGGTDSLMRPLATLAQDQLGQSIVVQNMTGGTGSIATQYVYDQPADGYNLLMGAENPSLYDALDLAKAWLDRAERETA